MGSIKYPLPLFEIEEPEEKSVTVACFYDKFKLVLSSLKPAPIVFVGVTEKWYDQTKKGPNVSENILESVRETLSSDSSCSKSSVQLSIPRTSSNDSKQIIWLWGPPIEIVSQENELVYIFFVNWISNQEINADTYSEFGTKSILLSICSRICEVTRGNVPQVETGLYDYLKHLRKSDYSKHYSNILIDSFLHVFSSTKPVQGYLQGKDLPKCKIIPLMDEMGNQFNIPEISAELADLTQIVPRKIRTKKMQDHQILNVGNVEDLIRSCVAAANSKLCSEALSNNLVSFHEKMETDENSEETTEQEPIPCKPLVKNTVPLEELKHEDDKLTAKMAEEKRLKIQQVLKNQLNDWVANIKTLDAASDKRLKNLKRKISIELGYTKGPQMKDDTTKDVDQIFEAVQLYVIEMSKIFDKNGYLSNDRLDTAHENVLKNINSQTENSSQNTKTFVNQACRQLRRVIKGHNETILKHQQKIVRESKSQVINTYTCELQRFRKEKGPFPPKLFQKISQTLFMRCMGAFTKSTEYKNQSLKNNELLKNELDDLAKKLMSMAEKQSKENKAEIEMQDQKTKEMEKLKEIQRQAKSSRSQTPPKTVENEKREDSPKRTNRTRSPSHSTTEDKADKELLDADKRKTIIKTIVQDQHISYREQFRKIINSPDFKYENIRKEHVEIVRKIKKLFEMDVRNKIGVKMDVKKLWQRQMHSELEKVYQIYKEAKQERKAEKDEIKAKRNTEGAGGGGQGTQSRKEFSGKDYEDDLETIKSPLVFQLTEQKIGMAFCLNGNPTILRNKKNEKWTLNLVGQTHKGKMVYGDEVNEQAACDRLREKWEVGKMIEDGDINRHGLFIHNAMVLVRVEILLGFLLKKLRIEAEKMVFHGAIKSCVVCIPYFYTSMQRQLVVDSARVAGFETVQLLNDISALAYEYAVNIRKRAPEDIFMVITESSKNIKDAALYKYESGVHKGKACVEHQVRMMAHVGNYHEDNDLYKELWKQFKSFFTLNEEDKEKRDQIKKFHKMMYNLVMQYHDNVLHKECYNKKECGSEILENVLKNSIIACRPGYAIDIQGLILNICGKQPEVGSFENMLVGAARLSSQNPKKFGHSVLDLLSTSLWLTSGGDKLALGKGVELTRHNAKFSITSSSNNTTFFQKLFGETRFEVLNLYTKFDLNTSLLSSKPREKLRVYFGVKNDGIFYVSSVELIYSESRKKIKTLNENVDYEIKNVFLKKPELKHYKKYVVDFFKGSSD